MSSLTRFCGALAAALMLGLTFSGSQPVQAQTGSVLISEFRFRGPASAADEFVELYNNTDAAFDISGYTLHALTGAGAQNLRFTVPGALASNTTVIPPRGHFLITGASYTLAAAAASNGALSTGIVDGSSIGLFAGATPTAANRVDSAGFDTRDALFFEGTAITPSGAGTGGTTTGGEYTFVRKMTNGLPQDTGNNQNDFDFVSTNGGTFSTRVSILGAPGPENLSSPVQRNAAIKTSLVNGSVSASASPNRVRSSAGANPTTAAFGTLSIQRRFTNNTPDPITRLRFRAVDITTLNTPVVIAPQADLRVLSSTGTVTDSQGNTVITVTGLTLETPPAQAIGGGLNSSLTVALPGGALAPGATLDVQFLLGVQAEGNFRFFVNVEALPATSSTPPATTGATKVQARTKTRADGNK